MKYKYMFVDESVEIELDEKWVELLKDLDRTEASNDKKERRRHCTLSVKGSDGAWLRDSEYDPWEMIGRETTAMKRDRERRQMKETYQMLTPTQKQTVLDMSKKGLSRREYARRLGVSPQAIDKRISQIQKKYEEISKKFSD